ncbi:hypothetical protein FD35_GL002354 [Furfurilactobacillus rossiae DSM 15814]|uniref:Uncharacterized protein n=1 Tax=Furfurilactobacillus rossiae DSM 15814 TaxID=1114972 RepID=A0A0R1RFZ3_9LACO|nr:hypothetical protein FD35_GL002354 [Furfurilactobacillus rossiae DSM 15814]
MHVGTSHFELSQDTQILPSKMFVSHDKSFLHCRLLVLVGRLSILLGHSTAALQT